MSTDGDAHASSRELGGGKFEVRITATASKVRADELGAEHTVPLDDLIDVGVLDENGEPIAVERRRVKSENVEATLVVDRKPAKAGIDPMNELIDRKPDDNVVDAEPASGP